ncbi:MAG: heavy metal translocating P-type ATPase, partial [Pseudomonadota bacterium]
VMMQVMMAAIALYAGAFDGMDAEYRSLLHYTSLLFTIPVVSYSAMPFFVSACRSFKRHNGQFALSMDVPIALAIAIAFLTSVHATLTGGQEVYYDSVVMFTFLLLGARYIDNRLKHRFDLSSALLTALPRSAFVEAPGGREERDVTTLAPGDQVWVPEGAQLPVDGTLISAHATVDEAVLTGESDWLSRRAGDPVYAGTLNRGPALLLTATAPFDRSRIADIAALADRAEVDKARITRLTDRIAAVFVPTVLGLATLTFIGWQVVDAERALLAALTVLVVSCPCALSLATPAALTAAMTRLRSLGIVLTRSQALDDAIHIDRVYLDKTGTLTTETPALTSIDILGDLTERSALALAGALERHSSHPYARAFVTHGEDVTLQDVEVIAGAGIAATQTEGQTLRIGHRAFAEHANPAASSNAAADRGIYLSQGDQLIARFEVGNELRNDAASAVDALKALGIEPVMLSGDAPERCAEVAEQLNLKYLARQTPETKLAVIARDQAEGHRVLMLGDGINDVPVLSGADLSAAVVEASDLVKSRADVLLLNRKLTPLLELFETARRTARITRQNLTWALAYNLTAIPLAAFGLMPPWLAALGMASSSILVMANATRLLSSGSPQGVAAAAPARKALSGNGQRLAA